MPENNFLAYAKKKARAASTGMKKFGKSASKEMNKMKKKMTNKSNMRTVKVRGKGKADMYAKGLRQNKVEYKRMKTGANTYEFRMKSATRKPASKKMSKMGTTKKTYTASELKKAGLKQMTHKRKKYFVKTAKQTPTNRTAYTRRADKERSALPPGRRYVYVPELRRYVSYTETRVDRSDRARSRV